MLVVMHMRGTPETMGDMCGYDNLISEVCCGLRESAQTALELGVSSEYLITDPGLGFAKTHEQNLELVRHCESFRALGWPVLIGASRKGFVGRATGAEKAGERLAGTLAVTALTCWQRADIIRVHDVKENKEVIKMTEAIRGADNV
ncbi:MAG: dihydropteroate synthase [Cloacibacillus sp.]